MLRAAVVVFVTLLAVAACQDTTTSEIQAFLNWFAQRGGSAPQLTLEKFPGMGVGIKAVQQVRENDAVIVVPMESVA